MSHLDGRPPRVVKNHHPTVKPQKLMRYLCRLVTPPQGVVLDPFMGSGSTGLAALSEGFDFVGIEREAEYFEIAQKRISQK
jgi:site-specific DNA-methyltransferase (adenine-specific)